MKTHRGYVPAPSHQCPPVDPKDLPTLRECLQQADPPLRTLAVVVASTGKRADEVRQMRRQDIRLSDRVWLYRPGRWLSLSPATCAAIQALQEVGPWVFPLSWQQVDHPWSNRAVEKSWERFRRTLPGALAQLTLTGLRASRDEWNKQEPVESALSQSLERVPFHVRQHPPNLSTLLERLQQPSSEQGEGLTL